MAPISTSVMKSVERFLEAAQQRTRIEAAYLYGSQAGGTAKPWSDIDLALVSADFAGRSFPGASGLDASGGPNRRSH